MAEKTVTKQSEAGSEPGTGGPLDRTVLPIPEPEYPPITELDARKAKAPPRFEVKAPKGAPNVVVILLDNLGFGDLSTFGGPIQMPTLDRLAKTGLRYNNFKVPPLCSPSRVACITGRNSHSANFGVISEIATGFPGYTAVRPSSVTNLPEILRLNGYSTAMFGPADFDHRACATEQRGRAVCFQRSERGLSEHHDSGSAYLSHN